MEFFYPLAVRFFIFRILTETLAHLKEPLEEYMAPLKIVKIVRASRREGLIRARMLGARASSAEVLTFLDSHIECTKGK